MVDIPTQLKLGVRSIQVSMRNEELLVAALVEAVVPGSRMIAIEPQSHGEPDYMLVTPTEASPFEVTRFTSDRTRATFTAILGRSGTGDLIARAPGRPGWWIQPTVRSQIGKLRRQIDAMLHEVDELGLRKFDVSGTGGDTPIVQRLWQDLRIRSGAQVDWVPSAHIRLELPGGTATLGSAQVVDAAMREVAKADNRSKLGRFATDHRHLGILLDELGYPACAAMQRGMFPCEPLMLPAEITHVWLFTWLHEPSVYRVWRYCREQGWRDLGVARARSPSTSA